MAELRALLARRLPEVMIPTAYVALDEMPRTTSGSLRAALPAPDPLRGAQRRDAEPPRGATEERLAAIWRAVLKSERPGRYDGFRIGWPFAAGHPARFPAA